MTTKSPTNPKADVNAVLADDGVQFINIYSNGKTSLGRMLSHFPRTPFIHPHYGPFDSMEGFWYWLRSAARDDKLRSLSGRQAKEYGKVLTPNFYPEFWEDILAADYQKVIQTPSLAETLRDSVLPFRHFYVFYPPYKPGATTRLPPYIVDARDGDKLCNGMEEIRKALQEDRPSTHWVEAEKRYTAKVTNTGTA